MELGKSYLTVNNHNIASAIYFMGGKKQDSKIFTEKVSAFTHRMFNTLAETFKFSPRKRLFILVRV